MKRFVIAFALLAFAVGFNAVVAKPRPGVLRPNYAVGAGNCVDPQPGKGKSKSFNCEPVECGPCEETVCIKVRKCWGCQPIPNCVP